MVLNRDYAALMLIEILYEKGLVNRETLQCVREKLKAASPREQTA